MQLFNLQKEHVVNRKTSWPELVHLTISLWSKNGYRYHYYDHNCRTIIIVYISTIFYIYVNYYISNHCLSFTTPMKSMSLITD